MPKQVKYQGQQMPNHTAVYMKGINAVPGDWLPCEICGGTAVDIHHSEPKGAGGNPNGDKDTIENLMGLCRSCHLKCESGEIPKEKQKEIHNRFLI